MLVTSTGLCGEDLVLIKAKLKQGGLIYTANLNMSTNVLVAKSTESTKYSVARLHGIPCVTPEWVLSGDCSMDRLSEYSIDRTLRGLEVCGASLNHEEEEIVRRICDMHECKYTLQLSRTCSFLVVSGNLSNVPSSEVRLARQYRVGVKIYWQFLRQYGGEVVSSRRQSLMMRAIASKSRERPVVYCFPPGLVTEEIKMLMDRAGVRHSRTLTFITTHVVLLSTTKELFAPRPGLEFVSLSWLRQCAAEGSGKVCVKPHVMPHVQQPVITLTCVARVDREALHNSLKRTGLHCVVQENLVLGPMFAESFARRNTTHLVVGDINNIDNSAKVASLVEWQRDGNVQQCFLVHLDWLRNSLNAGAWEDCVPYIVDISDFRKPARSPASQQCNPGPVTTEEQKDICSKEDVSHLPCETRVSGCFQSNSLEQLVSQLESRTTVSGGIQASPGLREPVLSGSVTLNELNGDKSTTDDAVPFNVLASSGTVMEAEKGKEVMSQVIVYRRPDADQSLLEIPRAEPTCVSPQQGEPHGNEPPKVHDVLEDVPDRPVGSCCLLLTKSLLNSRVAALLQSLGCAFTNKPEECTHYVTEKPSRTKYFLAAVAAGKWVLGPSFLDEMQRVKRIPWEEPHEWCPEMAMGKSFSSSLVELVKACRLQRTRSQRPFSSWNVALCCLVEDRAASFTCVLRSGGCKVVTPYTPDELLAALDQATDLNENINIVLSDDNYWKPDQIAAVKGRLPLFRMEYIAHCLCTDTPQSTPFALLHESRSRKRLSDQV